MGRGWGEERRRVILTFSSLFQSSKQGPFMTVDHRLIPGRGHTAKELHIPGVTKGWLLVPK